MINGPKDDKLFFLCECGCSIIVVDPEVFEDDLSISLYHWGRNNYQTGWRQRFEHIKHVLKHGHPFTDDVLLSPSNARRLGEYLVSAAQAAETKKPSLSERNSNETNRLSRSQSHAPSK